MIFISASKIFARHALHTFVVRIISHTSFLLLLYDPFEKSAKWLAPPQNVHFVWAKKVLSLFPPQPDMMSIFIYSVCRDEIDKDFDR